MVFAVAAVLDVVLVVSRLLAQEAGLLRACHMEALFAALPVAVHARTRRRLARPPIGFADVARLKERAGQIKNHGRGTGSHTNTCKRSAKYLVLDSIPSVFRGTSHNSSAFGEAVSFAEFTIA